MKSFYRISMRDHKYTYHYYIQNKLVFDYLMTNDGFDSVFDMSIPDEWDGLFDADEMGELISSVEVSTPEYPFILLGEIEDYYR